MADSRAKPVLGHLQQLLDPAANSADDGRLLERFVLHRDEDAFAQLVERHGPLVLGLSRRLLHNVQDAEDVFQATFLVLARKAATIRKPESLSCFLHGVAYRLAIKVRMQAARRRTQEQQAVPPPQSAESDLSWREVRGLIDEELQRLPEKQRLPLLLCYLEGRTQDEAARRLGWPRGTLKRRLEAGRERLRLRLTRRGVSLGAGLFTVALTEGTTRGAIPRALQRVTVQAGMRFTTGEGAKITATRAGLLAKEALQTLLTTKLKLGALLVLLLGCMTAAAGLAGLRQPPENQAQAPAPPPNAKEDRPDETKQVRKDRHGDPLPAGSLTRLGTVRLRLPGGVSPVVFTRDGKTALVGDGGGDIVYWDVATGQEVRRLPRAIPNWPCNLAITADGKILAAADRMRGLFLLDVATGQLLSRSEVPTPEQGFSHFNQILFAPDGRTLGLRDGTETILLWDAIDQKKIHELKGHLGQVKCMAFSPDGKTLASGGENDPHLRLWDIDSGKEKLHIAYEKNIELSLDFSPDGRTLAVIGNSGTLSFFDAQTGRKLRTASEKFVGLSALQYAPDGKTLAGIERWGSVCVLDAASGQRLRTFDGPPHSMNGLSFSPTGRIIATFWSVLPAQSAHAFDLWDVASGKQLHSFAGHSEGVVGLAFAADDRALFSLAGLSDGHCLAWDAVTGQLQGQIGEPGMSYNGMSLSLDGKQLAVCGDRALQVWDPATHKKLRDGVGDNWSLTCWVAWSAGNQTLVSSGHSDRTIRVWDMATGRLSRTIETGQDQAPRAILSPDSSTVAAGGYPDGTIHLWSSARGKELPKLATPAWERSGEFARPGHEKTYSTVSALAYNPDGSILASGGLEGDIHLWNPATGQLLRRWETKAGWLRQLAFSPDGRTLVTGHSDASVRLWEVATGQERACFVGHCGPVLSVAFAHDGRRVASGSEDTSILIWDVTVGVRPDTALSVKQLGSLWDDLIATDAPRAYWSLWRLAASPKQALPFLTERLRALTAGDGGTVPSVERLLVDLDSESFAVREKAQADLEKMGPTSGPKLRKALADNPSLEVRRRIESVLEKSTIWSGERLRMLRAIEAIEYMNTPGARRLVDSLANGAPHAWLTEEAAAIRQRRTEASSPASER